MTDSHNGAPLRAFLIHGLAGGRPFYFSGGLDVLARKLNAQGVSASVHAQGSFLRPYGEVGAIVSAARAAAGKGMRPVLIGHSMGADAALKVAVQLEAVRVAVPLVVCFDPTSFRLLFGPPSVPANVARALCFYQKISPLGRGMLKVAPGFKGALIQEQVATIHSAVDDDPALHARVLGVRKASATALIERLCDERLAFLKSLRTWPVFGAGWGRRVAEVRRDALAMAKGAAAAPSSTAAANGKASVPLPKTARTATAAGAVVASGSAAQAAASSGASWPVIIAILAGGVACAIAGWIGWTLWQKHKQEVPTMASAGAGVLRGALMAVRERLKGWRTVIFGGAVTFAGTALDILDTLQFVDISPLLPPEHALKIIAVIGIATVALRLVTTGRVGNKDC